MPFCLSFEFGSTSSTSRRLSFESNAQCYAYGCLTAPIPYSPPRKPLATPFLAAPPSLAGWGGGAAQGTRRGDKEESMSVTEIKKS